MAEWQRAVYSGSASQLSALLCASASSPEKALELVRRCIDVLEEKVAAAAAAAAGKSVVVC